MTKREISNLNKIGSFMHCGLCVDEYMAKRQKEDPEINGQSPGDYQRVEVGWTKLGIQIWCRRHDCNVAHIDFEGKKHPANLTRSVDKVH